MIAIEVEKVSKRFRMRTVEAHTTLKTAFVDLVLGRRRPKRESSFHALKDISLRVEAGRTLGIIGRNGSGKSTLLKLLAGILRPDGGRIKVNGKVSALLELGAGFHPEFSGRENIYINGIVLGLSKREVKKRFPEIVRFAELEPFIDEPVRTYSSGMYMRLGFAVAVHTDPDILLIDEILAVGDEAFQRKCFEKIAEFQRKGKTIVFVSHDLQAVEQWCDEAIWLDEGIIRGRGEPKEVVERYLQAIAGREEVPLAADQAIREWVEVREEATPIPEYGVQNVECGMLNSAIRIPKSEFQQGGEGRRWGSGEVEITSVRLLDQNGRERSLYQSGEEATVEIRYKVHRPVEDVVFGIAVLREDDLWCYGTNTDIEKVSIPPLGQEGVVEVILEDLGLIEGRPERKRGHS
ncbi:MAG: ABC transporter ATP-binding protein, partial [Candidatus Methylomirabilales bacterium]